VKRTVKWYEGILKAYRIAIYSSLETLRKMCDELKALTGFDFQYKADEAHEFVKEILKTRKNYQFLETQIKEAKRRGMTKFCDKKLLVKKGRAA
jgi:hypothetical protein